MRGFLDALSFAITVSHVSAAALMAAETQRPNVVLIMTDNHSPWTLGCYGNPEIRTPHIDRMAREGVRFTGGYSSNAVCSPTRATWLTGLIPSQHGVHDWLASGRAQMGPDAYGTIVEFRSLPEILAEHGYVCGLSGKWHLGDNLHPQEGFTFWITKPHGATGSLYSTQVIENGKIHTQPGYATEYWTRRGIEFINESRDAPFFLFLAYNGPYGHSPPMANPARNRHAAYYADKEMTSFPREGVYPGLIYDRKLVGNANAARSYAAEVSGIDDGVGEILRTLEENGLDRNTLVVFTADQGMACGHGGCWGMGAHTRPLTGFDWTMHVPLIYRHPGEIPPGRTSDLLVSNYDLMPTLLAYLGLGHKMPESPPSPGRDYSAVLRGENPGPWDDVVFFEYVNLRSIRTREWKYIERFQQKPNELYHLADDPGERENLVDRPAHAGIQAELRRRLHAFFDRYRDPQYDLWRGGRSKSRLTPTGG
ncbi:MAG: sulfatase-like hydrolase/transferase [Planctomycetota bacterium]